MQSTTTLCVTSALQIYTIHGYLNGEGMPLVWALLPNKTTETYVELFSALRDALLTSFGSIGNITTVLTDFERAVINAVSQVFPNVTVKGCSFHFRQAMMRRIQREGLKAAYEVDQSPVREWLRRVMAMTMLPAFAIPLMWEHLKNPPLSGDPLTDAKAASFATYVTTTWIEGDFPPSMWSHFDNLGPRTTNLAEGWHNGLNTSLGVAHPSLRAFLDWLQRYQFEIQCRVLQLLAGRPAKERRAAYVKVDNDIAAAKLRYSTNIGHVFCYVFPHHSYSESFHAMSVQYLDHMSYLVLGV